MMNDPPTDFDELVRALLDPVTTRQLAAHFDQMRHAVLAQLKEAGCPVDLLQEAEAACAKHQQELALILVAHAERLEAHQEHRPHLFAVFREQFGK